MAVLDLTPDELLSTTRAVKRRLDLERPVDREVLLDCLRLAQQAPTGSYRQDWHFVVVTDPERRAGLARLWADVGRQYLASRSADATPRTQRLLKAVEHLVDHLHEVPVHVIPCIDGRTDGAPASAQAPRFGSVIPAAWSFMLACRSRGLGTAWTTFHLDREREAAELLGVPYERVMQVALIPVAHTIGTDFRPAARAPVETIVHWDAW